MLLTTTEPPGRQSQLPTFVVDERPRITPTRSRAAAQQRKPGKAIRIGSDSQFSNRFYLVEVAIPLRPADRFDAFQKQIVIVRLWTNTRCVPCPSPWPVANSPLSEGSSPHFSDSYSAKVRSKTATSYMGTSTAIFGGGSYFR
jgi:hypothetical protein